MTLRTRSFTRNESGAAAIEFAIVMPVFLLLALGILAYGIYFGAAHSAAQLAADAARASVAGLNDAEREQIVRQHIATNAKEYILLNATNVGVEAGPLASDGTQFRVAVTYDATELPIWRLQTFVPLPSRIIVRTSTVKRGGF